MTTGRGGKRKGAGRKPSSLTKRTREIAEKAAAAGVMPADIMIDNMRYAIRAAQLAEIELQTAIDNGKAKPEDLNPLQAKVFNLRAIAQEAAKDAAPYFHPRLAAIAHAGGAGMSWEEALDQLDGDDDDDADGKTESDLPPA